MNDQAVIGKIKELLDKQGIKVKGEVSIKGVSGGGRRINDLFIISFGNKSFIFKPAEDAGLSMIKEKIKELKVQAETTEGEKEFFELMINATEESLKMQKRFAWNKLSTAEREYLVNHFAEEKGVSVPKGIVYYVSGRRKDERFAFMGFQLINKKVELIELIESMIKNGKSYNNFWQKLGSEIGLMHKKNKIGRIIHGDLGGCEQPFNRGPENIIIKTSLFSRKPYIIDFEFAEILEGKAELPKRTSINEDALNLAINESLAFIFHIMSLFSEQGKEELALKVFNNFIKGLLKEADDDYKKELKKYFADDFESLRKLRIARTLIDNNLFSIRNQKLITKELGPRIISIIKES